MRIRALAISAAVVSFSMPGFAAAQQQDLRIPTQRDALVINAGLGFERHSNIFARDDAFDPTPTYGKSSRSDTVLRGQVGVSFDRDVSLQRFQLNAEIEPTKFLEYSRFDHVAVRAGANWDWAIGRAWFGTLGVRYEHRLAGFDTYQGADKNMVDLTKAYFTAGMRLTPDWAIIAGVDDQRVKYSVAAVSYADYNLLGGEIGVRYARGNQSNFDIVARHVKGEFPNLQTTNSVGAVITPLDNGFKEDSLQLRVGVRPSNESSLEGFVGYASRKYDNIPSRDFSGAIAGLTVAWAPSGAFRMQVQLQKELNPDNILIGNHVDATVLRLRPTIQLTGKTALVGLATVAQYKYSGDAGGGIQRKDDLTDLGIGAVYDYARNIQIRLDAKRTHRKSNIAAFEYTDNVLSGSVNLRF